MSGEVKRGKSSVKKRGNEGLLNGLISARNEVIIGGALRDPRLFVLCT